MRENRLAIQRRDLALLDPPAKFLLPQWSFSRHALF